jgi:GTP cyclohydrolase IA
MKDASSLAHALHPAKAPSEVSDLDIEIAFRTILGWLGEHPAKNGLRDTPSRLRRAFKEYFSGYWGDQDRILRNGLRRAGDHHEAIALRGVAFHSYSEHNVAPIVGRAWIMYVPYRASYRRLRGPVCGRGLFTTAANYRSA